MLPDIQPLAALGLANEKFRRLGSRLVADCPHCTCEMNIVDHAFHCTSSACTWSRGGGIDFLARKLGGYDKAVALAGEQHPHFRDAGPGEVIRHQQRRAILDFFIRLESTAGDSDAERLTLRLGFQSATKIPHTAFGKGYLYLKVKDSNELVYLLAVAGITPPPNLQGKPVYAAPYWAFPHVLSHLVITSATLSSARSVDVYPHRFSWFGLTQKNPCCEHVAIYPTYTDAMVREEHHRLHSPHVFPTHLLVQARHPDPETTPANLTFYGKEGTWALHLPQWSFMPGFASARFHDVESGETDLSGLMARLLQRALAENFMEFLDLCSALQMDAGTRGHLLALADLMQDRARADDLRETLTRRLLEQGENYSLYESAKGYEQVRSGKSTMLSNFTLTLDSVISFSMLSDLQYQGRLVVGPIVLPFDVGGPALETPAALEKALQNIQNNRPGFDRDREMAIVSRKHEFRRILALLKSSVATLPRSRGVKYLGWSRRFDNFTTVDAVIDAAGIHPGVTYYPEESGDFHCFKSGQPLLALTDVLPELDGNFASLVAVLVAQVIRLFHNHEVRPLAVRNNHAGREKSLKLFRGLGQFVPLRLTNTLPRNIEINRGLPCLISGINTLQATKLNLSGLWLADQGFDFSSIPDEQIDSVASFLPALLHEVCRRLLGGELRSYRERRSVEPATAQAAEGAAVLRAEFWAEWPEPSLAWSAVDKLLEAREKELPLLATTNDATDTVRFPAELWGGLGFNRIDLVQELGRLCERVDPSEADNAIVIDQRSTYRFMHAFYGEVPRLVPA